MIPLRRPPTDLRMFHGWGDSVLWLDGNLSYEELNLPDDLVLDLQKWDDNWQELVGHAQVAAADERATGPRAERAG